MNCVQFSISKWSAWAPGVHGLSQWQQWQQGQRGIASDDSVPALKQVPAMLRRRLSRLSRMSLQVVYDCAEDHHQVRTVFTSPHGEIHRTKKLLDDMVAGERMSPMGFSLSVHNTASGLYSIASGNKAPSTAMAAGTDCLESAVIEAVAQLNRDSASQVLVVLADEPLPEFYAPFEQDRAVPFALGLLLDLPGRGGMDVALKLKPAGQTQTELPKELPKELPREREPHGLAFLKFLLGSGDPLIHCGSRVHWCWSKVDA
jgi:Beta-ketoacyl synthase, N-terminal domain